MEFRLLSTTVAFLVLCWALQEVKSHDCDRFCNVDDCSQYHGGSEFSPCVSAKIDCSCSSSGFSSSNGPDSSLLISTFVIVPIIVIICICCCVYCCIRGCCANRGTGIVGGVGYHPDPFLYPTIGVAPFYQPPPYYPAYYGSAWQSPLYIPTGSRYPIF